MVVANKPNYQIITALYVRNVDIVSLRYLKLRLSISFVYWQHVTLLLCKHNKFCNNM